MIFFCFACINTTNTFHQISISGTIENPQEEGSFFISAHHAWFGEGLLRYPAAEFDQIQSDSPTFSWLLNVPVIEEAEGLILYAWQDRDDDTVFCGLNAEEEFSGITKINDFPTFDAEVSINLDHSCLGPEIIYSETE